MVNYTDRLILSLKLICYRFLVSGIFLVISMILQFLAPVKLDLLYLKLSLGQILNAIFYQSVVLKLILDFLSDPLAPVWWGWTLVSILAIGLFSRAFFFGIHFMISHTVGKFSRKFSLVLICNKFEYDLKLHE